MTTGDAGARAAVGQLDVLITRLDPAVAVPAAVMLPLVKVT